MTGEDAQKILNVCKGANRRAIDMAYMLNLNHCLLKSQYDTCPKGRDQANQAIILLQDAYQALTGESAPRQMPNQESAKPEPGDNIPRASLSGKIAPAAATPSRGWMKIEWLGWFLKLRLPRNPETIVASLICAVMFFAALLVLACVHR